MLDVLYMLGASLIWFGAIAQIFRVLSRKRSKDISIWYIGSLLAAHIVMVPRAMESDLWVWIYCRVISAVLCLILLAVVLYYRKGTNENKRQRNKA